MEGGCKISLAIFVIVAVVAHTLIGTAIRRRANYGSLTRRKSTANGHVMESASDADCEHGLFGRRVTLGCN